MKSQTAIALTEEQEKQYGMEIAYIFQLKKSKEHPDRWETSYGTKTALGLTRTLLEIARKIQNGEQI